MSLQEQRDAISSEYLGEAGIHAVRIVGDTVTVYYQRAKGNSLGAMEQHDTLVYLQDTNTVQLVECNRDNVPIP